MRIAVCLSGQPRFYRITYPFLKKHLLDNYNCDVFIHAWTTSRNTSTWDGHHANGGDVDYSLQEIVDMYKPVVAEFHPQQNPYKDFNSEEYQQKTGTDPFIISSMMKSLYSADQSRQKYSQQYNIKYDWVIRTRFDCLLQTSIDLTKYDNEKINCPDSINNPARYCDWFNFSNPENMTTQSNVYNHLFDYLTTGTMCAGEELLFRHYQETGLVPIKTDTIQIALIRSQPTNIRNWIYYKDIE